MKGVSQKVDSCSGLIVQQALRTHRKLAEEHKRWIDPEDIIQEALMEAVRAEKRYKSDRKAKYSTYLHKGLFYDLRRTYTDRLRQKMRQSAGVVEIDAPIADGPDRLELPDGTPTVEVHHDRFKRAMGALECLCRAVTPPVRVAIVEGLLLQRQVNYGKQLYANGLNRRYAPGVTLGDQIAKESAEAIAKTGVKFSDFEVFAEGEKIRKLALIQLLRNGIMGTGETDARLLECVRCSGQFPLSAVVEGNFSVATMTCGACYGEMKEDESLCFGKAKTAERPGYSKKNIECRIHCIDRDICASNTVKGDRVMAKTKAAVVDELEGVDFDETSDEGTDAEPVKAKASAKSGKKAVAKAEKPAKPAKVAKKAPVQEEEEDEAPKEVGRWPFKNGSLMRWSFQSAYDGIKRQEFDDSIKKMNKKPEVFLKVLRNGKNGQKTGVPTHSWSLSEEGGRLKISNVKYYGARKSAAEAKPAKKVAAKAVAKKAAGKKKAAKA